MEEINASVKQVLAGDREAFSDIYNQTIHTVYRTLYFLTANKADLDDLVQDVYIELFKSFHRFDTTRPFQPWLYGITFRQLQAYRRKKWRQSRDEAHDITNCSTFSESDFSNSVVQAQNLADDIDTLSYKLKQVIVLHYLNDLTQEEISEILQIPLGTVKSRIHLALSQLRKKLRREMNV